MIATSGAGPRDGEEPTLIASHLSESFGARAAVSDLSLRVAHGAAPSGCWAPTVRARRQLVKTSCEPTRTGFLGST